MLLLREQRLLHSQQDGPLGRGYDLPFKLGEGCVLFVRDEAALSARESGTCPFVDCKRELGVALFIGIDGPHRTAHARVYCCARFDLSKSGPLRCRLQRNGPQS